MSKSESFRLRKATQPVARFVQSLQLGSRGTINAVEKVIQSDLKTQHENDTREQWYELQ